MRTVRDGHNGRPHLQEVMCGWVEWDRIGFAILAQIVIGTSRALNKRLQQSLVEGCSTAYLVANTDDFLLATVTIGRMLFKTVMLDDESLRVDDFDKVVGVPLRCDSFCGLVLSEGRKRLSLTRSTACMYRSQDNPSISEGM